MYIYIYTYVYIYIYKWPILCPRDHGHKLGPAFRGLLGDGAAPARRTGGIAERVEDARHTALPFNNSSRRVRCTARLASSPIPFFERSAS